ncbi:MAG: ABC transporter substrate binding protein, partial [Pseudolabrys sp.]
MRRRDFSKLVIGAAVLPFAAHAQQPERMRRIGVLTGATADDPEAKARNAAFQQQLQQLGWTEGRNVQFDYRFMSGEVDSIRKYAIELVALAPDIIVTSGAATGQVLRATRTLPIVFVIAPDPVGSGFVDSL